MDAPVLNQFLDTDPGNFAADGIETGQDDGLRRVVNDQIDACQLFDGTDIAAFTADDPALHFLVGKRDNGDGGLRYIVAGVALDGGHDNVARLGRGRRLGLILHALVKKG